MGRPAAWMGVPEEVFKYLLPKVPGHQWAECAGGRVADEVKVDDLLCDDSQPWAGTESLYLWAEDLATYQRWLRRPGRSRRRSSPGGTARLPPR